MVRFFCFKVTESLPENWLGDRERFDLPYMRNRPQLPTSITRRLATRCEQVVGAAAEPDRKPIFSLSSDLNENLRLRSGPQVLLNSFHEPRRQLNLFLLIHVFRDTSPEIDDGLREILDLRLCHL